MIQSGSCISRSRQQAETAGTSFASAVGCGDAAAAVDCLRRAAVARLIDTPADGFRMVRETPILPADPAEAVASGQVARVPIVIGANRNEGRTFAQGFIDATLQAYEEWVRTVFGASVAAQIVYSPGTSPAGFPHGRTSSRTGPVPDSRRFPATCGGSDTPRSSRICSPASTTAFPSLPHSTPRNGNWPRT